MKQRVLKRAGSTVATFLRNQCGDATLDVLSVAPEVGGVKDAPTTPCKKVAPPPPVS